jgi:glycosyltransferase involved in cell wall biosynthesis
MGIVAMEAQALGTPVIAFDGGTGPEVLADGRSGLLVRERDVTAFAEGLARLLTDDALADRLGASGPQIVRDRFDLANNTAALEELYDRVVAQSAAFEAQGRSEAASLRAATD